MGGEGKDESKTMRLQTRNHRRTVLEQYVHTAKIFRTH